MRPTDSRATDGATAAKGNVDASDGTCSRRQGHQRTPIVPGPPVATPGTRIFTNLPNPTGSVPVRESASHQRRWREELSAQGDDSRRSARSGKIGVPARVEPP